MNEIRQLSTSVINKIAAGEVIERPASVVKELVENSLDAGSTRIDVTVEKGGAELIRVTDNGHGVSASQLHLAVASHATSKIQDADDLFRVATLGFRGEALASIAEVSRLVIRSRPADAEAAAELEIVGGRHEPIRPIGAPQGTMVEVRQLFFNTPVRHKFLRTTQTEMGHLTEAVTRLALAHPQVHFTITHGGRQTHDLTPTSNLAERVAMLFGEDLATGLIEVNAEDDDLQLRGYVANPTHSRGNNRMQYLFLNGRFIRDRSLQHALGEAYRGLLLTGRYPIGFLHLTMSPAAVDVNVHPTKLEVRFAEGGRIYSHLLGSLRTKFLSTDLVARANLPRNTQLTDEDEVRQATPDNSELFNWAKQQLGSASAEGTAPFQPFPNQQGDRAPLELHRVDLPRLRQEAQGQQANSSAHADGSEETDEAQTNRVDSAHVSGTGALQIHNRYLVTETEEGLEVIDQHALHERILYEALREKVLSGALETQKLLVPEPVDVAANEAAAVLEHQELLAKLGMDVEPFGGETLLVSSYPAMLANLAPGEVLRSLIEKLLAGGKLPDSRDLLDELLHMISCKAAVKYGDSLTSEEVTALLEQRHLAQDHHHCPHGRPTALVFTREQLDRQFKRI
ncbi:DNA mismatch repair endonuclease MutL [Adhaeretor mobilis]|uniref:DNA mismatch repair protein MutL n=1 Tax=Adhaeretor mobilis TaxID=1930276 RepID=A0A517MYZ0_9BACT|nr:DNA mismatch repair endonuclease MutL [Adhaeretor mobilis]QDT00102.1 DNA mismatch repair protein MutL [Adhaeretor mobilis]